MSRNWRTFQVDSISGDTRHLIHIFNIPKHAPEDELRDFLMRVAGPVLKLELRDSVDVPDVREALIDFGSSTIAYKAFRATGTVFIDKPLFIAYFWDANKPMSSLQASSMLQSSKSASPAPVQTQLAPSNAPKASVATSPLSPMTPLNNPSPRVKQIISLLVKALLTVEKNAREVDGKYNVTKTLRDKYHLDAAAKKGVNFLSHLDKKLGLSSKLQGAANTALKYPNIRRTYNQIMLLQQQAVTDYQKAKLLQTESTLNKSGSSHKTSSAARTRQPSN